MPKLLVSFAVVCLTAGTACSQPAKVLDEKYGSPGFALAATFEPPRLHKAAKKAGLPVDDWWKYTREQTGLDLTKVERVTALHEPLLSWSVLGMGAVALRYPKGTDPQSELVALLGGEVKKVSAGERTYLASKKYRFLDQADLEVAGSVDPGGTVLVSVWPPLEYMLGVPWDDKRFEKDLERLLARSVSLGNMAEPTGKATALGKVLNGADLNHDLVLVFTPKPVLDKFAKKKDWKDPPADLSKDDRPMWLGLKRIEAVVATVDFNTNPFLRVEFRAGDDEGAKVVLDGLKALLAKAKVGYPEVRKELLSDLSPEVRTPLLTIVDEVVNDHTLVRNGSAVGLTIKKPKNLVYKE